MGNMQAKVDKSKSGLLLKERRRNSLACRFIFNSTVQSSGKLWSVNHPGLYPRNLYCEYIFHGKEDQIVHIHFEYFDVEGFNQLVLLQQESRILVSDAMKLLKVIMSYSVITRHTTERTDASAEK